MFMVIYSRAKENGSPSNRYWQGHHPILFDANIGPRMNDFE
jgi:hypothetical protein